MLPQVPIEFDVVAMRVRSHSSAPWPRPLPAADVSTGSSLTHVGRPSGYQRSAANRGKTCKNAGGHNRGRLVDSNEETCKRFEAFPRPYLACDVRWKCPPCKQGILCMRALLWLASMLGAEVVASRSLLVFRTRSRHTLDFKPAAIFDLPLLEFAALEPAATLTPASEDAQLSLIHI